MDTKDYSIDLKPKDRPRIGVMLVGLGGNNGSTFTAGLLAYKKKLHWHNKRGRHQVNFLGSISQFGSVLIGYDKNGKPQSKLFKDIADFYPPEDIVVGGWDICKDNLKIATNKAKVIDYDLLQQLIPDLEAITPLPSIYDPEFIASNQNSRADNIIPSRKKSELLQYIMKDITQFRLVHDVKQVVIVWTASTERFNSGGWTSSDELNIALDNNDPEISPSIIFAMAAARTGCIFLNGSPQNTLCPAVIDHAKNLGTFVGGEDFKTGQTKLKSALMDWLVSSGIRPLSIVSYNHLGNNDGKNLDEAPQFRSKEITKRNVIDDVVEENPHIFSKGKPDHAVVIKYIPAVGDSKRAMDEYHSEIFLDGRHTLAIHNTCEDSLLAAPLILDIILFAEFFSRIQITKDVKQGPIPLKTALSFLSFFFKAPVINPGEPLINTFFKQRYGLENFFRILVGLPPHDFIYQI